VLAAMFVPEINKMPQLLGLPIPPLLRKYVERKLLRIIGANMPMRRW
jgi:hypothetical protein